jgi:predicted MFS family arabinose efflux permease
VTNGEKYQGLNAPKWSLASSVMLGGLALVSYFNYMDRMALSVFMEPIKRELALSDTQAGLITGMAFALFYAVMGVPIGRLIDRGHKVGTLLICFVMWSAMTALSGLATSFAGLFVMRLLVGVGEAGCLPASFSIISDHFSAEQRPLAISIFQASGKLGVALGMVGAGFVAQALGWRMALMTIGAAGVPVALVVLWSLRGAASEHSTRAQSPTKALIRDVMKRPGFMHLVAGISLASFATYGIVQWLPAFLVRSYGASLREAGVINGLSSGVGAMCGTLVGGLVATRLARRRPMWDLWLPALVYAAATPLFLCALLSSSLHATSVLYVGASAVAAAGGGVALAAVQRFAEPAHRATANALMLMISAIAGVGFGPVFVGMVSDWFREWLGPNALRGALACSAFAFAWASLHFVLASRVRESQSDLAPYGGAP